MGAVKAIISTREVADLIGVSDRHARRIADGTLKDGKRQYDLAKLPPDAQIEWAKRNNVVQLTPQSAPGQMALSLSAPIGPNLSEADRYEAEKRYRILEPLLKPDQFRAMWAQHKNSKVQLIDWLAKQHKLGRRTIYNWLDAWKDGGITRLVPKDRSDKGLPKVLNGAALDFIIACAFPKHGRYGKLTVRDIFRAYGEERTWRAAHIGQVMGDFERSKYARYLDGEGCLLPGAQLPEASYSSFRNWYDRIPEIAKVMAREGDEAFHNTQEILSFRDLTAVKPMDYVVMDHRRLDFFCLVQQKTGWQLMRPWLTAAIDMRTRKWLGWAIVETPSSDSIATVLKRVFLSYGLPVAVYWDNGKDFRCEWLEGRTSKESTARVGETIFPGGVMETLGIRVHHAIVRRARSKIIEPNFGRTADFDRTLPWWCGHKPGARPTERFDKLLNQHERWLAGEKVEQAFPTIEDVARFYPQMLEELNERDMEGAEGMNKITPTNKHGWMCPNEAWERLIPTIEKRVVPEDVLQFCFAKRRELTVQHGEVKTTFGGQTRHYRPSGNPIRLAALNGYTVEFAYDPLDLQTAAIYYESRLVGLVECLELRKMGEDTFVEDEKDRRRMRRETKAFIAGVHEAVHVPDHAERHARRAVIARPDPRQTIAAVPVPAPMVEAAAAIASDRALPRPVVIEKVSPKDSDGDSASDGKFDFFA